MTNWPWQDKDAVARAQAVVQRGTKDVTVPVLLCLVGGLGVAAAFLWRDHWFWAVISIAIAFSVAWIWWEIAIRRWWRWAVTQDANIKMVEELAEEEQLIWSADTWIGRRQRRTWMALPEELQRKRVAS